MINVGFDTRNDVLYLSKNKPLPCYCEELCNGILFRYTIENNIPNGVTIIDYHFYWKNKIDKIAKQISLFLEVSEIEIKDILQRV